MRKQQESGVRSQGSGVRNQRSGVRHQRSGSLLLLAAILLTGCVRSQEARLYILDTPESLKGSASAPKPEKAPAINIASVQIPDHLSRPVVITQVAENELAFSDFHRWAGPLQGNVRQVLIENLSIILRSDLIFADPRKQAIPADYHVEVGISQLTGILGETATLEARWVILASDGREIQILESFQKTMDIDGESRRDYVNAQSTLFADLAQAIADSLPTE